MISPRKLARSLSLLLLAAPLAAADGDLDDSFWGDGKASFGSSGSYEVDAVVEAPDGRIVVVGTYDGPGAVAPNWFWRAIGDDSASTSSTCFFVPPGGASEGRAHAAAFDGAGRLLVAGSAKYGTARFAAARFAYPDCSLDDSFDGDGYWTLDVPGGEEHPSAIAIHPGTGRIALGGTWYEAAQSDMVVALLSNTGALVTTFSGNGWRILDPQPGSEIHDELVGIAFTESGKVIAAGTTFYGEDYSGGNWTVAQLTSTGALDVGFSGDGLARIAFDLGGTDDDRLHGLARDRNSGELLLTGSVQHDVFEGGIGVARLHSTGALDTSFSDDGKFDLVLGAFLLAYEIGVDGLGRVVVAGSYGTSANDINFCSMRFTPEGDLDSTFGFGGLSVIAFEARPEGIDFEFGTALTMQAGRVVVAGDVQQNPEFDHRIGLARLEVSLIFADGFESASIGPWSTTSAVQ